ncbi:DNA polymerase [Labedaea rhizosphaerae]|uniref:DNA-directed DNA polymerase n=1 Tax=Labedaea rhizosphaerae TaxID=598644 RepID=A0A4R6SDC8_LABRH|nr:DNA polymerase [Labedaea rhizosphaerae]TDP97657.1 P4 family phage/plasmid primase-like protein [Labedaea rhizosphaerae]
MIDDAPPGPPAGAFAAGVLGYQQAGWPCILPVPAHTKHPPPVGFTGADGRDTEPLQLVQWVGSHGAHSIALRLPDNGEWAVIGVDVDHYDKGKVAKRGAETLAAREAEWGSLPDTWCSTARGTDTAAGPSRILFFRVPSGRYRTKLGPDIEVIQRHHRYAVVAPSDNPAAGEGARYRWYGPDGRPLPDGEVPKPIELPELPARWIEGLREGATEAGPAAASRDAGQVLLAQLEDDSRPACAEIYSAAQRALAELGQADEGGRHDTATERVYQLVQLAAAGHAGVGAALHDLGVLWFEVTAGEDRGDEWERILLTAARKAVTQYGGRQVDRDPCLLVGRLEVAAPAPANDTPDGTDPQPIAPARVWSVREVIGVHPFDPRGSSDQTLAAAALDRMGPALRYAADAGTWLLRGPVRWDTRGDLTQWAVAELAGLMPRGNPDAEKGSDEFDRAKKRQRFLDNGGARKVAGKMAALVAAGTHPSAVELGDLDREPEVLWAGGVPWDLRASADVLTPAHLDPGTPHLHSAAVLPVDGLPTPRWDAFLAAVMPDPEVRAWALRVLAITLTGYPDAAMPIMLGKTRRGKSQTVELVMSVLGSYAHAADPRLLGAADTAHASIVYALRGRRLSFVDEGPREGRWAQERLKQITGGAMLTANQMHRNPISFRPTHTLVLTANDEPVLTDPAIRARVRLIPCEGDEETVRAARAAIGQTHGAAWRAEAPGVLAQLIHEAGRWLADRSSALTAAAPDSIRLRAEEIAAEQDPITNWVEEETEPDATGTKAGELYRAFVTWCRDMGLKSVPSATRWGRELTGLGHPAEPRRDGKFRPLRLRRPGGWAPLLPVPTTTTTATSPAGPGLGRPTVTSSLAGDQLVTSSTATGHTTETAAHTPVFGTSVTSVTSSPTPIAHARAHDARTRAPEAKPAETYNRSHELVNPAADQRVPGSANWSRLAESAKITAKLLADGPVQAEIIRAQRQAAGEPVRDRARELVDAGVKPSRAAIREQKAAEKRAAKAAERAAAIAAAAGEVLPLPLAVDRAGNVLPLDLGQAAAVIDAASSRSGGLTVDVETSGYPVGHELYALRTVQLGDRHAAVVLDPAEHAELIGTRIATAPRLRAHSATADLVPLADAELIDYDEAWLRMDDTVIPAKLADPRQTGSDPGLKLISAAVLGPDATAPAADEARKALFAAGKWLTETKVDTPIERSGWAQVDFGCRTMAIYAASDVLDTGALDQDLPKPDPAVHERERIAQRMTARVAYRGVRIDGEHVERLMTEHEPLRAHHGERVRQLGQLDNPGSDVQVGNALLALGAPLQPAGKSGRPSVAEAVLTPLSKQDNPVGELAREVLAFRHHDTVIGTFLKPYHHLVRHGDGRARPTIYTLGADTGRMSCVRPNFQQLPREGGVRACITADPGHLLISADFSGVELRVAAALSGDMALAQLIAAEDRGEGDGLHWLIARQVYGPNATKGNRYHVKRAVFGRLYGSGIPGIARTLGIPESEAAAVAATLDAICPGVATWSAQVRQAVKQGGTQYPTYSGRVIHLDKRWPHKAPNYLIQGTARELLIDALIRWQDTRWGTCTLWPVHDEVDVQVPEAEADAALAELVRCMETELFGVRIVAEPSAPAFAWQDSA